MNNTTTKFIHDHNDVENQPRGYLYIKEIHCQELQKISISTRLCRVEMLIFYNEWQWTSFVGNPVIDPISPTFDIHKNLS